MNNGNKFDFYTSRIIPVLTVALIVGFVTFWSKTNDRLTKLEDNQKWMEKTYTEDKIETKEDWVKLEKKIGLIMSKEDGIRDVLQQILTRLGLIEYELKINGKK